MEVSNVIQLHEGQQFSFEEAQQVVRVIYRFTKASQGEVKNLVNMMESNAALNVDEMKEIEGKINAIVDRWNRKVSLLGGLPKGLWIADFDSGQGYYCWKYPESQILYHHGYKDGYSGRKRIAE